MNENLDNQKRTSLITKISNKFKELSFAKKATIISFSLLYITMFAISIWVIITSRYRPLGVYALITLFFIPLVNMSFAKTLNDIRCTPDILKIKNTTYESDEKKVDAYFDLMEEKGFSIFAPFVLLILTIGSGFIYKNCVTDLYKLEINLKTTMIISFHILNISIFLHFLMLRILYIIKKKSLKGSIIPLAFLAMSVGTIVASFYSDTLLLLVVTSFLISFTWHSILFSFK